MQTITKFMLKATSDRTTSTQRDCFILLGCILIHSELRKSRSRRTLAQWRYPKRKRRRSWPRLKLRVSLTVKWTRGWDPWMYPGPMMIPNSILARSRFSKLMITQKETLTRLKTLLAPSALNKHGLLRKKLRMPKNQGNRMEVWMMTKIWMLTVLKCQLTKAQV